MITLAIKVAVLYIAVDQGMRMLSYLHPEITSQNESLTVCSIDQADPIRVFQIQTKIIENSGGKIIIENIRYIV